MSHVETEFLLVAGILAFYLFDSARLLHFDDLEIAPARGAWRIVPGGTLEVRGRFLHLPNPLWPAGTRFIAGWLHPAAAIEDADAVRNFARGLWPVRAGCMLVAGLVLVAIPLLLLVHRDPAWLLAALAAASLVTLAMLALLFARRKALRLDTRRLLALSAESLLCPPCAPNMYRKLCAWRGWRGDPVAFAAHHLPSAARPALRAGIEARIALFALVDDDEDGRVGAVHAARGRIRSELA